MAQPSGTICGSITCRRTLWHAELRSAACVMSPSYGVSTFLEAATIIMYIRVVCCVVLLGCMLKKNYPKIRGETNYTNYTKILMNKLLYVMWNHTNLQFWVQLCGFTAHYLTLFIHSHSISYTGNVFSCSVSTEFYLLSKKQHTCKVNN